MHLLTEGHFVIEVLFANRPSYQNIPPNQARFSKSSVPVFSRINNVCSTIDGDEISVSGEAWIVHEFKLTKHSQECSYCFGSGIFRWSCVLHFY